MRFVFEITRDHRRLDMAGAQAVDSDPVGRPFHGQVPAQLDDGCFGGVVDGSDEPVVSDHTGDASDEDDGARDLVGNHTLGHGFGGGENACVVDGHHLVDVFDGVFEGGCDLLDACGGD